MGGGGGVIVVGKPDTVHGHTRMQDRRKTTVKMAARLKTGMAVCNTVTQ